MTAAAPAPAKPRRKRRWLRLAAWSGLGLAILALALGIVLRLSAQTDAGRSFVASRLEGLSVGRLGRLHVEGLGGDLFSDATVQRLTIADAKGVWLDARGIDIAWRPLELIGRRAHLTSAAARRVQILRQPELGPEQPPGKAPVAVVIDRLTAEIETMPAASVEHGLFGVTASLDAERDGALSGAVAAQSRLRAGDGMTARFDIGGDRRLAIDATAHEAQGGALAGLAGLPAQQAFLLDLHAGGAEGVGWLSLKAMSGTQSIAEADGRWTHDGGQAAGRLSLAASRWTAPLMKALGPDVRFSAAGRPAANGLFGVALFLNGDNAAVQAQGVADAAHLTSPNGLSVTAEVADLRRIVAAPAMGRGTFAGRLTGGFADLHLTGEAAVEQFGVAGYSLARLSGPVDILHDRDAWRLKVDATGEGGRGAGLLAALVGGRPQASLAASRLGDGRILIQSLRAAGAGLSIDATGQQGLLGDLAFKGTLRLSNLAAARAGAHGAVEARWSAAQGRAGRPWSFDVDATGQGLGTSFAELDRLLGASPRLSGRGDYDRGTFAIDTATLTGAAATAHAAGPVGIDGTLKLALNWTARGPFAVGPVEIAGDAKGSGAVTGTFAAPRADLLADFAEIDVPDLTLKSAHVVLSFLQAPGGANGDVALTAASDYGPAHARADFRFLPAGVALTGIDAVGGGVTAAGALTLTNNTPSVADLTLNIGPGAVLTAGHADAKLTVVDAAGGPNLTLAAKADGAAFRNLPLTANAVSLSASGPMRQATYKIDGDLVWSGEPLSLNGAGAASQISGAYAISFSGAGKLRKTPFRTLSPALFSVGGPAMTAKASVAIGAGRLDLDARETGRDFNATAKLAGVDVATLDQDFAGRIDADLSLTGHDRALSGTLTAHLAQARVSDASAKLAMDGDLRATLAGSQLDITATAVNGAGGRASANLALPAEASAAPFRIAVAQTRPMSGQFNVQGEIEPIYELFFGGERSLGGQVAAQGQIAGTMNSPDITGHATLTAGHFEDSATGLKLRNVAADADFNRGALVLHSFSGTDAARGAVSGDGELDLAKGGASNLVLTLRGFQLIDNETAKAVATGQLTLARDAAGKAKLAGSLVIDSAVISAQTSRAPPGVVHMDVVERNRPAALDKGVQVQSADRGISVALDIRLRSASGVTVRGLGLNAQMSLDALVAGDTARPLLSGTAHVVRGDYQFAGQRFEIDNRGVVDLATSPDQIRLDLSATREDPSLTAIISIKGTAAKPVITLSSSPSLPNDEILAQVLFGRSAAQLSPVEAAELAAAVTTLATGGGFDVMGGLQNFARLDRLALGGDSASGITVSGGKYIGKNVYLELTGGGRSGPSAEVEVRAGRGLSVVSQVGGLSGAKIAIRWRRDYGRATDATKH